jgi:hypothetical protein
MNLCFKPLVRILRAGFVVAVAGWAVTPCAQAADEIKTFNGICDASAAVALGPDTFVVADDESNVLRVYKASKAEPIESVDLGKKLGEKEADLEGAARVGSLIYWVSSHGLNKEGEKKKSRFQFFALDDSRQMRGEPYHGLMEQILKQPWAGSLGLPEASTKAPEKKGLNIEALAAWGAGGVVIGLRSPVPNGKAIAVPLENPQELLEGKPPRFSQPLSLDLGGLGIRSMEKIGDRYWIVGGPMVKGENFTLFSWNGKADDKPKLHHNLPKSLNVEALFEMGGKLWLLSDDGENIVKGNTECKKLPQAERRFRAVSFNP